MRFVGIMKLAGEFVVLEPSKWQLYGRIANQHFTLALLLLIS